MPSSPESIAQEDVAFMQLALQQAEAAAAAGEVPVGAVVVKDGLVIGSGHNSPLHSHDPSAHAEINALRAAANTLGNYRLDGCTLYVTLEPCAMCCGAMLHARLQRVVFGAAEPKTGCAGSVLNLFAQPQLNHQTRVEGGVLAPLAALQLQQFFQGRRSQSRAAATPLREDALRTPERFFEGLEGYPWQPHYVSDLPSLAGLRLHYLDEGPRDAKQIYLCLHPIPGWSYHWRSWMASRLGQGARVLAPDLIGFGRSDKPKREDVHTLDWHLSYLLELLQRLAISDWVLVLPATEHPLAQAFKRQTRHLVVEVAVQALDLSGAPEQLGLQLPYPDAGHRAGERAFSNLAQRELKSDTKGVAMVPPKQTKI